MSVIFKPIIYIIIIFLAAILKKAGMFKNGDGKILSKIVMNFTLPAAIISSFADYEHDSSLLLLIPIGFLASIVPLLIMFFVTKKSTVNNRIFYMLNLSGHNIGGFALPVMTSFFGAYGTILCVMFDIGNAILMSGGSYALTCTMLGLDTGEKKQAIGYLMKLTAKRFFLSTPLDVYIIMVIMIFLNIRVPETIATFLSPISAANPFLAMFMIGLMFDFNAERTFFKDVFRLVSLRIGFSVCASLLVYFLTPFSLETRQILSIIVFAPIGSLAAVFVDKCGGDTGKSSFATTTSILISFLIMIVMSLHFLK